MFIYLSWLPLNWNEMEDRRNRESRALYRASMFYLALYERYMHRPIQRGSRRTIFAFKRFGCRQILNKIYCKEYSKARGNMK